MEETSNQDYLSDFTTHLVDVEEKQRLLKDRVLLIGENLIVTKEEQEKEIFEMKKQLNEISEEIKSIKQLLSRIINTLPEVARKSELEMLQRQFDMFQPFQRTKQ